MEEALPKCIDGIESRSRRHGKRKDRPAAGSSLDDDRSQFAQQGAYLSRGADADSQAVL
jgi:hypothetical protein